MSEPTTTDASIYATPISQTYEPTAAQAYNAVASNPQPLLDERDKLRNALRHIWDYVNEPRRLDAHIGGVSGYVSDICRKVLPPLLLCFALTGCGGLLPPLPTPTPLPDPVVPTPTPSP